MTIIRVKSLDKIEYAPPRTIIGVGEEVFEVLPKGDRAGEFINFEDEDGNLCLLYVRRVGKIEYRSRV